MSNQETVNSNGYWDQRFNSDWDANGGREQSRFFAQLAVEAMPQWLVRGVQANKLTVCDWGCAEGDGTELLSASLHWDVTGIDFSGAAIERARAQYAGVKFSHENLLECPQRAAFDVLFSSNTLEHFANPWDVFDKIADYASQFVVLLIPYREYERHAEHEVTFEGTNIPMIPKAGWALVHHVAMDASRREPNYWRGDQILLVYARTSHQSVVELMLADIEAGREEVDNNPLALRQTLSQRQQQTIHALTMDLAIERAKVEQLSSANAELIAAENRSKERIHFLQHREQALGAELDAMRASTSWRVTAPLRAVRRAPSWLSRRAQDVRFVYKHGGVTEVVGRSFRYLSRRAKAAVVTAGSDGRSLAVGAGTIVRAPRERRALPDVFVFSIIDWHFRIQRPQHLAREFARAGHRVYFFSNHFEDAKEPGFSVERIDEQLSLYQVKLKVRGAPAIYFDAPATAAETQMMEGMRLFHEWSGTDRSYSLVQHAYWYPVATSMQSHCIAYDCMDHHEGFGNVPQVLIDLEHRMMRRADLLVATSSWLEELAHKYNPRVAVVRNAGQYSDFCEAPAQRYVDEHGRKIIGYYGAIAEWFDAELVAQVAREFPDALVLLVGGDTANVGATLAGLPNVKMTGEVPYKELPYYLYAFDVCMLPFKVIPLTLATNPVKVYEYLAAGRSVVSIDLPEMSQFGDLVRVSQSHEGFIEAVSAALRAQPEPGEVIDRRKAFAAGQTWAHRVQTMREAIEALPKPKVSVVVLTYNNLLLTKDCLDSVEKYSDDIDLELVVVDNASSDETPAYLTSWAASRPHVKLILNPDNRGFAAGNNQGLAAATGDYLVILNNDTVVTRGWARRMVNHLKNAPDIGLLGPTTNNIGNEARVETRYTTLDEMQVEAEQITEAHLGKCFEFRTAAFFCAMLPRSTYETCGPLSEEYGLGFFEDDDYCRCVERAGLKVMCAEDVFVHHHLSASFNKLGAERKRALFEQNRAIYEAKWGAWTAHEYRPRRVRH